MGNESEPPPWLTTVMSRAAGAVWLVDLDDTLVPTAKIHLRATESLRRELEATVTRGEAEAVALRFNEIFAVLLASHQSHIKSAITIDEQERSQITLELDERISFVQQDIRARWNRTKRFSREVLLLLAAQDTNVVIEPEHLSTCTDAYWDVFANQPEFHPGALDFMRALGRVAHVYIMTGSDARLTMNGSGQFTYDPENSRRCKQNRLAALSGAGLQFREAFIGDPIDKPDPAFFEMTLESIRLDMAGTKPSEVVVFGDSFHSDLETPLGLGLATRGLLLSLGQPGVTFHRHDVASVESFDVLRALLPHED